MAQALKTDDQKFRQKCIGYIVALVCMFILPLIIQPWDTITDMGVKMICTFLGVMVLFMTTGDLVCGSMLGCIAVMIHGYTDAAGVWQGLLGNATSAQILFMLVFSNAVRETGALEMLGRWIVRKTNGIRKYPTLFNVVFMLAMFVCNLFLTGTVCAFTLIPMFEGIAKSVGYTIEEKWHKIMITGMYMIAGAAAMSRGTGGMAVGFVGQFTKQVTFAYEYKAVQFMIAARVAMILFIILYCLAAKFIFKCDMKKLATMDMESVEELRAENVKFSKQQIWMLVLFLIVVLRGFISNPFAKGTGIARIYDIFNITVTAMALLIVSSIIKVEGKPLANIPKAFSKVMWGVIFSLGTMTIIAGSVSNEVTGIRPWLVKILTPVFGTNNYILFCFLVLLFTCFFTNLMSNQATIIIMMSVTATFIEKFVAQGINPTPLLGAIVMTGMIPLLTYSAGPLSPLYLGRPEMDKKFVYTTGISMMLLSVVCMTFSAVLFGNVLPM